MARNEIKAVQRLVKIQADSNGDLIVPDRIHLISVGHWHTPWHGAFEMTATDLADMVIHFEDGVGSVEGSKKLPINYGHDLSGKAAGWIVALSLDNNGTELWGDIEWTPYGKQMLAQKEFRYISPEWNPRDWPYENPEVEGEFTDNVITGAGLTNIPLFKALTPIMASIDAGGSDNKPKKPEGGDMTLVLDEVRVKKLEDLTDEEKAFVEEHKAELTDDERTAFGLEVEESDEDKAAREAKEQADQEAADKEAAEQKKRDEEASKQASAAVTISASKLASLEADAKAGRAAQQELQKNSLTASITKHIERGAIKSDELDSTVDMLMAQNEEGRKASLAFMDKLPSNTILAAEAGKAVVSEEAISLTASERQYAADFNLTPEEVIEHKKNKASKERE